MENLSRKHYYIFLISFVVLNILATFIITTEALNRYIISFNYTFGGIVNSVLGNLFILLAIIGITNLIVKTPKNRIIVLLFITFVLNAGLFAINIFNRYYGTSFTFSALAIFKNPGDGFGMSLVWEALRELVTYYRIILFIPIISLSIYYVTIKNKGINGLTANKLTINKFVSRTIILVLLFFVNVSFFTSRAANINIVESSKATYATQNIGIYNFLFLDSLGFDFQTASYSVDEVKEELDKYNKNKDSYTNFLDNKVYTKSPVFQNASNLGGKLFNNMAFNEPLTGVLKDYNLVLVQLESFNSFLLEIPEISKHFINLNALMEQSYVFNNFYSNVGLGNTFDAELALLSGLMPNGTSAIAWDFDETKENKNFNYQTLPKLFKAKDKNSINYSYHGNREDFYNRDNVHPKLFGFDQLKGKNYLLENNDITMEDLVEQYQHDANQWLSDRAMIDFLNKDIDELVLNNKSFMQFIVTLMPHTPYHHDPYFVTDADNKLSTMYEDELKESVDIVTLRYLNYVKYLDELFRVLFEDFTDYGTTDYNDNKLYDRKKTAYVFYGDHGSGVKEKDLNYLFDKEFTSLEARDNLAKTSAFIYVPGDEVVTKTLEDGTKVSFKEGLFKGSQDLVRSQIDLHRTIIDLFDLPIENNDYLFGVHGLSNEPTYSLANKSLDYTTDRLISTLKNETIFFPKIIDEIDLKEVERLNNYITRFKKFSDIAMNENMYHQFKKKR